MMTETLGGQTGWERLRWSVADGWTLTRRSLAHWAREPSTVIFGLAFPVVLVLMFGYLFGGAISVPGGGEYREFLMPGMFAMIMLFGIGETIIAVSRDAERGITDRFRSMPIAPPAVVVGRCVADMLYSTAVLAVIVACGLVVGWRPHGGVGATALGFGLVLLLRFAFVWLGIYLGLVIKGQDGITLVQTLEFPLGFLSGAFVATSTMPGWLGTVADWNPLSSTVSATRELFGNPGWGGDSWIANNAVPMSVLWPLLIVAIFFPLSVRRYRRLSR